MNLLEIKRISDLKGISIRSIAKGINMSEQNLYRCMRENKIGAHVLEKICSILEEPITTFFDIPEAEKHIEIGHHVQGDGNQVGGLNFNDQETICLQDVLKEKERIIKSQEKAFKEALKEKERIIKSQEMTIQILIDQQKK